MLTVRKLLSGHMDKIPDLPFASCTVGPHGADRFSSLLTGTRQAELRWALSSDLASRDSGYTHWLVTLTGYLHSKHDVYVIGNLAKA